MTARERRICASTERNIVIGRVDGVLLTVVYCSPAEDLYRMISARLATAHERKAYEQNLL